MGKYSLFISMSMLEQWLLNTQDQLFILACKGGGLFDSFPNYFVNWWLVIKEDKSQSSGKDMERRFSVGQEEKEGA